MTNLEYINKQILFVKQNIQYHKKLLAESEEEYADTIKSAIKFIEPDLQILEQIKDIIEAWEVINKTFKIGVEEPISEIYITGEDYYGNDKTVWGYSKEGVPKVKKALEVKDELKK